MNFSLEGRWRQLAATENGEVIDLHDEIILTITGSTFFVKRNGEPDIEGIFHTDSLVHPTTINWKYGVGADSGKIFKSLCMLSERHFEFCASDEKMPLPQNFEPGMGRTVRRFERIPV